MFLKMIQENKIETQRRRIEVSNVRCLFWLAISMLCMISPLTLAQTYPVKPIRLIIPWPPGGTTDVLGRMAAQRMTEAWGIQVIADNRPGAGGNIGFEMCAKSPPDGYTLCIMTVAQAISPSIYGKLGFDPTADFAHVTLMAIVPSLLLVHPSLPVKNVQEFIALAKSKPGRLSYASTGNGTSPHMMMEMFKSMTATSIVHIPYKGVSLALIDQISGLVESSFGTAIGTLPFCAAGKNQSVGSVNTRTISAAPGHAYPRASGGERVRCKFLDRPIHARRNVQGYRAQS